MPQVDLPLEELWTYSGTNPKPDDFDRYWSEALAELDAVDPQPDRRPADFSVPFARCEEWYFTGTRGARIHAKCVLPRAQAGGSGRHPALLRFHGYSMSAGDWVELLPYAAAGFVVCALDVRGQGGKSTDPGGVVGNTLHGHIIRGLEGAPEDLLFRHIYLDTVAAARLVMALPEVDTARIGVTGGSQGGGLSLACAALEPRIARVAAIYPFLCDYQRVWDLDLGQAAYEELREYFRRFDPRHENASHTFTRLGYVDVQHLAPRITGRTMVVTGLMDEVCPPSTQFAAFNKIKAEKQMIIYPDFSHENLPDVGDRVFQFMLEM
jgi:cephalosporin-C deacetylase